MRLVLDPLAALVGLCTLTLFPRHAPATMQNTVLPSIYVAAATAATSHTTEPANSPLTPGSLEKQSPSPTSTTATIVLVTGQLEPAKSRWLPELTSSPQQIIPPLDGTGLSPAAKSGSSVWVFVFDRVNLRSVSGLAIYGCGGGTVGGPFVTNASGFTRIFLAPGREKSDEIELEIFDNYQPLFTGDVRLWPSNPPDRRFRLHGSDAETTGTFFLPVVPVVRAEVSVYELPFRRMINVPVTLTPLDAVVREPLTLPAGAEDELVAARFAIPAHEGDTYRVSIGENVNTGARDIGIFTVHAYREPIELRINLYPGPPPLEVITTEH